MVPDCCSDGGYWVGLQRALGSRGALSSPFWQPRMAFTKGSRAPGTGIANSYWDPVARPWGVVGGGTLDSSCRQRGARRNR